MKRYEYNYGKNPEGTLSTISGYATETTNFGETAFGILNKSTRDEENFTTPEVVSSSTATLFSVGNGTDHDSRKNIIELKADGTVYINGVGQYDGTNPGESTNIADEFQGIHDDITGLNEDVDRIDNTIESIHISEDDENLIYTLLVDGQERGTINIPRDQFLKDVSYNEETNNLEFTFIVRGEDNEEVEKQINVNMTDLEDIYSAGDGLSLENKQFSVKVDADTQPYIEVSSNGVKVIGIDEKFNTVNQNVTDLTNRVTTAESDIDAIQDELANLEGSGEGSVQDQINNALEGYLPLSGGTLTGSITFESEPVGNVGDAVLYDKQANKLIVVPTTDDMDTQYPANDYEPIGIVVIPASHDVYGTGQCGVMSLKEMNCDLPDTGSTSYQGIYWGQYEVDLSLPNLNEVPIGNSSDGAPTDANYAGYLPSDNFSGGVCAHDSNSYYSKLGPSWKTPSPYLSDESRNLGYSQTSSPCSTSNRLADFDGIGNSQVLLNLATAQSDWRTTSSISNSSGGGYSPAACCCWRYHTSGTQQGDWYLPAMGELGYLMVRLKAINEAISKLITAYGSSYGITVSTDNYWSSSECHSVSAAQMSMVYGAVTYTVKEQDNYVRAFLRVLPTSKRIIISGKSDTDLLNAAGGTTSISDILAQVPAPDLSPYATKEEVGSNTYTDSNYLSKETNLTDAVVQLDEEIKATNDNLALEHANAEATYAKKTDLSGYLPLAGGTMSDDIIISDTGYKRTISSDWDYIEYSDGSEADRGYYYDYYLEKFSDTTYTIANHILDASNITVYNNDTCESNPTMAVSDVKNIFHTIDKFDCSNKSLRVEFDYSPSDNLNHHADISADLWPTGLMFRSNVHNLDNSLNDEDYKVIHLGIDGLMIKNNSMSEYDYDFKLTQSGIYIKDKTENDLLNAGGSTTSVSSIVTQVQAAIVDSAPETLDTLNELAAALGDDPNFATTITNQMAQKADKTELPTVQSGQSGTTSNYVYSSAADESYRVLSDISCTRTGDVVKLQGRTWGMASNSSLDLVTLPLASSSMAGLISTADKSKLDQISITQGDIVASGFRITDGTANEVLTADGDSNTLKTINGQTLLGSGDVDMSEFALKTDLDDYLSAGGGTVVGNISVESIEDTNTLTITNTGINISGKTNNDLIAAAGGTISIDDLKTQIISDLSAQVSTLQTQISTLTSRIEALETSLTN